MTRMHSHDAMMLYSCRVVKYQTYLILKTRYRGPVVAEESCRDVYVGTTQVFYLLKCIEDLGQSDASSQSRVRPEKLAQGAWSIKKL